MLWALYEERARAEAAAEGQRFGAGWWGVSERPDRAPFRWALYDYRARGARIMECRFTLEISLGNDAMSEAQDVAVALRRLADRIEAGHTEGRIMDANGNTVGEWVANYPLEDRG